MNLMGQERIFQFLVYFISIIYITIYYYAAPRAINKTELIAACSINVISIFSMFELQLLIKIIYVKILVILISPILSIYISYLLIGHFFINPINALYLSIIYMSWPLLALIVLMNYFIFGKLIGREHM